MRRGGDRIVLAIRALVGFALGLLALKVVVLALSSLKTSLLLEPGAFGLDHFERVLSDPAFGRVSKNTAIVAATTVTVMMAFAVPFAWLYTRTDLPAKRLMVVLLTVQVAVPGFLIGLAYVLLLNPSNGILNRALQDLFGVDGPLIDIYGITWIGVLQGLFLVPSAFFLMVPAFQGIDSALEESAFASGVGRLKTVTRIVIPLMRPVIVSTAILYAVVSVALFDFAATLGIPRREFVFSTWIFQLTQPTVGTPNYGAASALGVLLVAGAGVAVAIYFRTTRRAERFALVTGRRGHQGQTSLGRQGKIVAWALISVHALFTTVVPVAMLGWASLLPYLRPPSTDALESVNLDAYSVAWSQLRDVFGNTALLVTAVPTITVVLAACLAWVATRSRSRSRRIIDVAIMGSVGIPPIVAALAFLYLGLSIYRYLPIYASMWLMVFAFVARYLSYAHRVVSGGMLQVHVDLEDAASTAGVNRGRTMLFVILPIALPAMAFAWMRVSMFALGELTMPLMLQRPGLETVSTSIWSLQNGGRTSVAAAMGVLLVAVIAAATLLFQRVVERWRI